MSDSNPAPATELIYTLNDKPPALQAFFAALQHMMAIFVGIVTPPIIISGALGLSVKQSSFVISMALFASGISTFIQVRKFGPVGSGLLSIQGTSFTFLGSIIATGLAAIVLITIIILNRSQNKFVRMSAIFIGLVVGYIVAAFLGKVNFDALSGLSIIQAPVPFKFGFFKISWASLVPFLLLYLITTVESIGDLTATSMVSGEPIEGDVYMKRISGGVLGDGINSAIAAIFNSFPNTTFSQNNGVIQMTGVASRRVGFWIAGLLVVAGLFPFVGGLFSIIPPPVLGGATIIMFGTVAAAGVRIIASSTINRRGVLIMAISFGLGLGVTFVPEVLKNFPPILQQIFGSAITTGGLSALFLNLVLPRTLAREKVSDTPVSGYSDMN